MSSMKRLQNDITIHEDNSDRRIPNSSYYIILLQSDSDAADTITLVKKLLRVSTPTGIVTSTPDRKAPLCAYVYKNIIYLLFSSVEEGEHYLSGNHHAVCSKYTSLSVLELGCEVSTKIIELETRTKVLVYLYGKECEHMKQTVVGLSKGKIAGNVSWNWNVGLYSPKNPGPTAQCK